MSNEIAQTAFDYGLLDEDARIFVKVKAAAIHARLKRAAEDIIAIGHDLKEVQDRFKEENEGQGYREENKGNGQFVTWLKKEFEMSVATAYNFMAVATKFGDPDRFGEKFLTVRNFSPKVLYALATASDQVVEKVIEKVESKEISPDNYESIKEELRIAKEEERKTRKAKEEAEKRAEKALTQLTIFQSHSQLAQNKIDELTQQIATLTEEIKTLETPETIEVTSQETLDRIASMEAQISTLKTQKKSLYDETEKLTVELRAQRDANEARRKQEQYEHQIREGWKKATEALYKSLSQFIGQIPSPIAIQVFEGDDWARYDQIDQTLIHFLETFRGIKTTRYSDQFVESSTVDGVVMYDANRSY